MRTDSTYFIGEIFLPNLTGSLPEVTANVNEVNRFIAKYEPEYLIAVLGQSLYDAFVAGIKEAEPAARWTALDGRLIDSTNKISPIADYVYYHIQEYRITATTAIGEVEQAAENAIISLNTGKMAKAYNNSVRKGIAIREWLSENSVTYPEYVESDFSLSTLNTFGI